MKRSNWPEWCIPFVWTWRKPLFMFRRESVHLWVLGSLTNKGPPTTLPCGWADSNTGGNVPINRCVSKLIPSSELASVTGQRSGFDSWCILIRISSLHPCFFTLILKTCGMWSVFSKTLKVFRKLQYGTSSAEGAQELSTRLSDNPSLDQLYLTCQ